MPAADKAKGKAAATAEPAPAAVAVSLSPKAEIALLEKRIAEDQARLHALLHPRIEFPKAVKDRVFASREEQDAAGPDYAEV